MINSRIFTKSNDARDFFRACGSFGTVHGTVIRENNEIINRTDSYEMVCRYTKTEYGVYSRKDTFRNLSDKPLTVNTLKSVFTFDGGEYEAYSQYNSWQTESTGVWSELSTGIHISARSVRTSASAAPFLALWNRQNERGGAFHLVPESAWEITARLEKLDSMYARLRIEAGILEYNLSLELQPGQSVELPEIIFYGFTNKTDTDCYKLHRYMNEKYPARVFPAIYNSWLYNFDKIDFDMLAKQVPVAAEMGFDYFVIDAGWFGKGDDWYLSVGDWEENLTGGLCGRMLELAELVRKAGMKFGLWFEPERAAASSDSLKAHPEWYLLENGTYFLDFANKEAMENMLGVICSVIDKYGIEYVKFDFNADMETDDKRSGFLKYHEGHKQFIYRLRERHPSLYITNCASGGARMNLAHCRNFDSFWPSDNESPYDEMRMYRESVLRLPPRVFEKYTCIQTIKDFKPGGYNNETEKIIACNDATWYDVAGVHSSHLKNYFVGSPIGFSCDLTSFSAEVRKMLGDVIAASKADSAFWLKAECRILCSAKELAVYQYSDSSLSRIVITAFFGKVMQQKLCVYPVVDENKTYIVKGEKIKGGDIAENGIDIGVPQWKEAVNLEIRGTCDD